LTKIRLIAVAALAALTIAGCGGGDDSSNKSKGYSEFSAAADKVCSEANPDIEATANKLTGKAQEDAAVYDELVPKLDAALAKFKQLDPPSELQSDYDSFVSTAEESVRLAKTAQAAAKTGDQEAYGAALSEIKKSDADEQNDLAASKLGAKECIGNGSS
jgi:hypothetical protein